MTIASSAAANAANIVTNVLATANGYLASGVKVANGLPLAGRFITPLTKFVSAYAPASAAPLASLVVIAAAVSATAALSLKAISWTAGKLEGYELVQTCVSYTPNFGKTLLSKGNSILEVIAAPANKAAAIACNLFPCSAKGATPKGSE